MKNTFTLEQARELLPRVKRLTVDAAIRVARLAEKMTALQDDDPLLEELDDRARVIVGEWMRAIEALGAQTKGLWLVDFDSGDGYFCWHYPEPRLEYFHTYAAGFAGRRPLAPEVMN